MREMIKLNLVEVIILIFFKINLKFIITRDTHSNKKKSLKKITR